MIEKNKYMGLEFLFTFCLLSISFFMLRDLFWPLGAYFIAALIFGFFFSWLTKRSSPLIIRVLANFCAVIIVFWMIYSLLNSSFYYSEVVLIYLKGVFALQFIFSLIAYLPQILVYTQVLSIPVFMSAPLFAEGQSIIFVILAIGYIICWVAILKIKLYSSVNIIKNGARNYYYIFFAGAMFLIIVLISGIFFSKFSLGKYKGGGILPGEAQEELDSLEGIEKDYYSQLEKVNSKIQQVIANFKLAQENRQLVSLFSPLVNESLGMEEVNNAEAVLLNYLAGGDSGLEINDLQDLSALIKRFIDKKSELNLKKIKELILSALMRNVFSLKEKIIGYSLANKIQNSSNYRQIRSFEIKAKAMINNSSVSREAGDNLKDLFRSFREWKNFDIYRKQSNLFMKQIESLDTQTKNKVSAIFRELNRAQVPEDFKKLYKEIQDIQSSLPAQSEWAIKKGKELFYQKLEVSFLMKSREIREKIENQSFPKEMTAQLKEQTAIVEDMQEPEEFINNSLNLVDKFKKEKTGLFSQLQDLLEIKRYALIREEVLQIAEILKNSTLSGSGASFIKSVEELTLEKDPERIIPIISKLEHRFRQFINDGFISKEAEVKSVKAISNIKHLILFKINKNLFSEEELKGGTDKLNSTLLKKEKDLNSIKGNSAGLGVVFSRGWLAGVLLKIVILAILTIIVAFTILFFLAENTKNKLRAFFLSDQRKFIINLYGQFRIITGIFGVNNAENLPPLLYAKWVESLYSLEGNTLLKFTEKFEKAKYSQHILKIEDAKEALESYNYFLKMLFSRYRKFSLFCKYSMALKHKLKLKIIKI